MPHILFYFFVFENYVQHQRFAVEMENKRVLPFLAPIPLSKPDAAALSRNGAGGLFGVP